MRKYGLILIGILLFLVALSIGVYQYIGHFTSSTDGRYDGWGRATSTIPNWLGWVFAIFGGAPIWAGWKWALIDIVVGIIGISLIPLGGWCINFGVSGGRVK